jgi:hypothetical protein
MCVCVCEYVHAYLKPGPKIKRQKYEILHVNKHESFENIISSHLN